MKLKLDDINHDEFAEYFLSHSIKEIKEKFKISELLISKLARDLALPRKNVRWLDYKDYVLTEKQLDIINGSLLGDGSLYKIRKTETNSYFVEDHCDAQKDWLKWKHDMLLPLSISYEPKLIKSLKKTENGKMIKDSNNLRTHYTFYTMAHPIFTNMEKVWYKRDNKGEYVLKKCGKQVIRIKIIPSNFSLTPMAFAVWFMDDGNNHPTRKNALLCSMGFTIDEVEFLVEEIKKLGIKDCHMLKDHAITINRHSYLDCLALLKEQIPDLVECMQYKVATDKYVDTDVFSRNTSGIPFFTKVKNYYTGHIKVNKTSIYLGKYDNINDAKDASNKAIKLMKNKCKDIEEYEEILKQYKLSKNTDSRIMYDYL